jgi:DNA-binding CsgD family transcriptional regulator
MFGRQGRSGSSGTGSWALGSGRSMDLDLEARVARLTAGQRACLELVDDHATSKEIALRLGISRHTVDARLRQAMQILGVASRREAAVIWRAASGSEPYQSFAYQSPRIESPLADVEIGHVSSPPEGAAGADGRADFDFGEREHGIAGPLLARSSFRAPESRAPEVADAAAFAWDGGLDRPSSHAPSLRLWGGVNDLTLPQRLAGILIVTILAMLAFGILLSGISALADLRS